MSKSDGRNCYALSDFDPIQKLLPRHKNAILKLHDYSIRTAFINLTVHLDKLMMAKNCCPEIDEGQPFVTALLTAVLNYEDCHFNIKLKIKVFYAENSPFIRPQSITKYWNLGRKIIYVLSHSDLEFDILAFVYTFLSQKLLCSCCCFAWGLILIKLRSSFYRVKTRPFLAKLFPFAT